MQVEKFEEKVKRYLDGTTGNLGLMGEIQFMSDEGIIRLRGIKNGGRTVTDFDYSVYEFRIKDYLDIEEQIKVWKKSHNHRRTTTKSSVPSPLKGFSDITHTQEVD